MPIGVLSSYVVVFYVKIIQNSKNVVKFGLYKEIY
jgi:hypothetical protein